MVEHWSEEFSPESFYEKYHELDWDVRAQFEELSALIYLKNGGSRIEPEGIARAIIGAAWEAIPPAEYESPEEWLAEIFRRLKPRQA